MAASSSRIRRATWEEGRWESKHRKGENAPMVGLYLLMYPFTLLLLFLQLFLLPPPFDRRLDGYEVCPDGPLTGACVCVMAMEDGKLGHSLWFT